MDHYERALAVFRNIGDAYAEADTMRDLGGPLRALNRHGEARDVWRQALELYLAQERSTDADRVRQLLDNRADQTRTSRNGSPTPGKPAG